VATLRAARHTPDARATPAAAISDQRPNLVESDAIDHHFVASTDLLNTDRNTELDSSLHRVFGQGFFHCM
jgi:hypothetical protein